MAMLGISIVHRGLCLEVLLAMVVSQSDTNTSGLPLGGIVGSSRITAV